jgi:AcrR family transcriptional regulator
MDGQRALGRRRTRRPLPEDRLEDLIRAAAAVFSRRGYRRTQMAEVAHQMGVSPGNLYNYVEGKDALFHLVLRRGFGERPGEQPPELPVTGASVEVTSNWVARRLDFVSDFPELEAAFARTQPADPRGELEAVVGELYDVLVRLRVGVDVLERSIEDLPELARRRPHDPEAAQISDAVARQTVCCFTTNALLAPAGPSALMDGSQRTQQQR